MEFFDLLPEDPKLYDKMRPPKKDGQATVVYFHVTVMGLDSIDENSMVSCDFQSLSNFNLFLFVALKRNVILILSFSSFNFFVSFSKKKRKKEKIERSLIEAFVRYSERKLIKHRFSLKAY